MKSAKVLGVLLGVLMMMEVVVSLPTSTEEDPPETTTTSTILMTNQSSGSGDGENYNSDAVIVESLSDETGESEQNDSEELKDFNPSDCSLEKSRGPCRAVIESWYFNGESCEMFMWSGCGGNNNRFREKSHCEKRCMSKEEEAETPETIIETTLNPIVSRIMETTMETLSSSLPTTTSSTTTTLPPATSTTSFIKSKSKFRCPKFEACPKQCVVLQSVQSNRGCKTCQCAEAESESDVNSSSSSSSSTSVKTTRSTSKSEVSQIRSDFAVKSSIGSVSGIPKDEEDSHNEKPEDVCNLPQPPRGNCRAMLTRYRYDSQKTTCVEFHFGGNCDGSSNANNFVTKEKCIEFCKGQ